MCVCLLFLLHFPGTVQPVQHERACVLLHLLHLPQGDLLGGHFPLRDVHGLRPLQGKAHVNGVVLVVLPVWFLLSDMYCGLLREPGSCDVAG